MKSIYKSATDLILLNLPVQELFLIEVSLQIQPFHFFPCPWSSSQKLQA